MTRMIISPAQPRLATGGSPRVTVRVRRIAGRAHASGGFNRRSTRVTHWQGSLPESRSLAACQPGPPGYLSVCLSVSLSLSPSPSPSLARVLAGHMAGPLASRTREAGPRTWIVRSLAAGSTMTRAPSRMRTGDYFMRTNARRLRKPADASMPSWLQPRQQWQQHQRHSLRGSPGHHCECILLAGAGTLYGGVAELLQDECCGLVPVIRPSEFTPEIAGFVANSGKRTLERK